MASPIVQQSCDIVAYYQEYKTALFSTSLTLGTFLFAMKSFIVQIMKTEIYDKPTYQEKVAQRRREGADDGFYRPLNNLKRLLFWAIAVSFLNAGVQLGLGHIQAVWVAVTCFAITGLNFVLVAIALCVVSYNLSLMISLSEDLAVSQAEKNAASKDGGSLGCHMNQPAVPLCVRLLHEDQAQGIGIAEQMKPKQDTKKS